MSNKVNFKVAALENGTVIDHIPSQVLFKVVDLLGLQLLDTHITIGNNLESKKYGKKGIIKIANKYFEEEEINRIALIAPNAIINIIRDYQVAEKKPLCIPSVVKGIIKCSNPKCITNNEPMTTLFKSLDEQSTELKCQYCERTITREKIELF